MQVVIRDANELYEFAKNTMKEPAPSRYQSESVKLKRRIEHMRYQFPTTYIPNSQRGAHGYLGVFTWILKLTYIKVF